MTHLGQGAQQGALLLAGGGAWVLAQPDGDAEDLQQFGQVAQGVVLEQVGPDQDAQQAHAGDIARLGAVAVLHPTQGPEGLAGARAVAQGQQVLVVGVKLKAAVRDPGRLRTDPGGAVGLPGQGQVDPAVEQTVAHVDQQVLDLQTAHDLAGLIGGALLGGGGLIRGQDGPVQLGHRLAALGQIGLDLRVLLLHVARQLVLAAEVAGLGLLQDAVEGGRGQAAAGVLGQLALEAPDHGAGAGLGGIGLDLAQGLAAGLLGVAEQGADDGADAHRVLWSAGVSPALGSPGVSPGVGESWASAHAFSIRAQAVA